MYKIRNENGSAILIALCIMSMLTIIALSAVKTSNTDVELSYNQLHGDQAFYVAEAGSKHAFAQLNDSSIWRAGYSMVSMGPGTYHVTLIDSLSIPALDDTVLIRSEAEVRSAASVVQLWTVPERYYPFQYAMFGDNSVLMENGTCTDSYRSDSGSYAATQVNDEGDIGSNGTVTLQNTATVGGDAQTATPDGITQDAASTIVGDTTTGVDSVEIDIVSDSEYTWAKSVSLAPDSLSGSSYNYNPGTRALTIGTSGTLTLTSGVYYFSSIKMEQDADLIIAPGASVTIYLTGDLVMENNTRINPGGLPIDCIFFSKGSLFKLENTSEFYGGFYGPDAVFKVENNTALYGSIVAEDVILENAACFHYDRLLGGYWKGYTGDQLIVAWRQM